MDINKWTSDLFASIDAMDASKFASFFAEDCAFTMGNFPATIGKSAVETGVAQFFQSIKSLKHSNIKIYQDGNSIFTRGEVLYTRHNETTLSVEFINHLQMEGDLVKDYRVFIDISMLYS